MTPGEVEFLRASAEQLGARIDEGTFARLGCFVDVLSVWNRRLNLLGDREERGIVTKHVPDCLAVVRHMPERGPVIDIGAGAGFPGLVVSCARPDLDVILIEARRRRASFLAEAVRTIGLERTVVLNVRAEAAGCDPALARRAPAVIARAVRLEEFLTLAEPLLRDDGIAIAMQTPRLPVPEATRAAASAGLHLISSDDYVLPGGERRRLLLFARG